MRVLMSALILLVVAGTASTGWARTDPPPQLRAESVQEVRCPVMGGVVKDPSTALKSEYKGRTYYFCCPGCKPMFDADPEKYVGKSAPRTSDAPAGRTAAAAHAKAGPPTKW